MPRGENLLSICAIRIVRLRAVACSFGLIAGITLHNPFLGDLTNLTPCGHKVVSVQVQLLSELIPKYSQPDVELIVVNVVTIVSRFKKLLR